MNAVAFELLFIAVQWKEDISDAAFLETGQFESNEFRNIRVLFLVYENSLK
jgi:hypothetical protein